MKVKELRKKLCDCIDSVVNGDLSPSDGRNIVGMANQINLSMQAELKKRRFDIENGQSIDAWGDTELY